VNKYKCKLTGKSYSEATIKSNLSQAYREYYLFETKGFCEGCNGTGVCTAHIIPKARCKQLHLTSLIWNPVNWFRACYLCNQRAENVSSDAILELKNFETIKEVVTRYDPQRAAKLRDIG
jgi:hypothetical protein